MTTPEQTYTNTYITTVRVSQLLVDKLQHWLDQEEIDFHDCGLAEDDTLITFTAKFLDGCEADIKVCSGQHNCFIDPVFYNKNGCQAGLLDPGSELLGEYSFDVDGDEYIVELVAEDATEEMGS
jgi:hypothetical protein